VQWCTAFSLAAYTLSQNVMAYTAEPAIRHGGVTNVADAGNLQDYMRADASGPPPQPLYVQSLYILPQPAQLTTFTSRINVRPLTMAHLAGQQSFFADEMFHHQDVRALSYDEGLHTTLAPPAPLLEYPFRPLLPSQPDGSAPLDTSNALRIQVPGVLSGHVETQAYSPVNDAEWAQAEIDYDATSPMTMSSAESPATPGSGYCEGLFSEHCVKQSSRAEPPNAFAWPPIQDMDMKPRLPTMVPPVSTNVSHVQYLASPSFQTRSVPESELQASFVRPSYDSHDMIQPFGWTALLTHNHKLSQQHQPAPALPLSGLPLPKSMAPARFFAASPADMVRETAFDDSGKTKLATSASMEPHKAEVSSKQKIDRILLEKRAQGWAYRRIKRDYGLTEAESTLRGRHRALTKDREERVRKPVWTKEDVSQA
jgi:hypothetical protein